MSELSSCARIFVLALHDRRLEEIARRARATVAPASGQNSAKRLLDLIAEVRRLRRLLHPEGIKVKRERTESEPSPDPVAAVAVEPTETDEPAETVWKCRGCGKVKPKAQMRRWNRLCFACMPSAFRRKVRRVGGY